MKYCFYVIEETSRHGGITLVRSHRECGEIIVFGIKAEAMSWKRTLDNARGDISSFRLIKLREVE